MAEVLGNTAHLSRFSSGHTGFEVKNGHFRSLKKSIHTRFPSNRAQP